MGTRPDIRVVVAGGGAAGFMAAITCAEACPGADVIVLERSAQVLGKVRISGGGRCNVTNALADPQELSRNYPRGGRELIGPLHTFGTRHTIQWFERRGVRLKTEPDGRVFPVSDSSRSIMDCLIGSAERAGVKVRLNRSVEGVTRNAGSFEVRVSGDGLLECERLMLATGGCRAPGGAELAESLGHRVEPPVPSLFALHMDVPWLNALAGVACEAEVSAAGQKLRERGPVLITHQGLSGPAVLRLSAWGARPLHVLDYRFPLTVNWLPHMNENEIMRSLEDRRSRESAKRVTNTALDPLPSRLWEALVLAAGIAGETRWAELSRGARHRLAQQLMRTELPVSGKSLNKEEFVTCGGVRLSEVDLKTMQSRVCPGLFFGGEVLDMDGVTGGFNFQAAWTTGWLAGLAMADRSGG